MCSLISPIATLAWQIGHSQKREPGGSLRFIDRQTARLHIRFTLFKRGLVMNNRPHPNPTCGGTDACRLVVESGQACAGRDLARVEALLRVQTATATTSAADATSTADATSAAAATSMADATSAADAMSAAAMTSVADAMGATDVMSAADATSAHASANAAVAVSVGISLGAG